MLDPMADLILEAREATGITDIVGVRVRGFEPNGATETYAGDARGAGHYIAFLVLVALSVPPERRVPVTFAEYAFRAYGRTKEEASELYGAVVDAFHRRGPRLRSSGLGIYSTWVTGGAQEKDPKTQQPYVTGTIQLTATTQVVTA